MIDFLNLKESNKSCECLFKAHSLQLLPYQYDPYVIYIGQDEYPFLDKVDVINVYGEEVNIINNIVDYEHERFLRLTNINYDDVNNVVLKLTLRNDTNDIKILYSDEIKISSYEACKTTKIHFKCKETDVLSCIQYPLYFFQPKRNVELESAYQISTKSPITYSTANSKYNTYQTDVVSIDSICKLSDALQNTFVYFDYKRVVLFDAVEIPDRSADEMFGSTQVNVAEYKGIGTNDITPIFNLVTENNDNIITEEENNIILE